MKYFGEDIRKIYQTERWMFVLMLVNLLAAIGLIIFGAVVINPESSVIKTGYSDIIGGYQDGSWVDLVAFPVLGVILGVFHNLIALKIYHKRGAGMAKFFLLLTTALIIGGFIVLARLSGEG